MSDSLRRKSQNRESRLASKGQTNMKLAPGAKKLAKTIRISHGSSIPTYRLPANILRPKRAYKVEIAPTVAEIDPSA